MKTILLAASIASVLASSSYAATLTSDDGLYINFDFGYAIDGVEVLFEIGSVDPLSAGETLTWRVFDEIDLGGSLIGSRSFSTTLFSGSGGYFVVSPDSDGRGSILASASNGTVDYSFQSSLGALECSSIFVSSCVNGPGRTSAFGEKPVDLSQVSLPATGLLSFVALIALLAAKASERLRLRLGRLHREVAA